MHKILVFFIIIILVGCRAPKPVADVIIRDRLVAVEVPADSALVAALVECDSNYRVVLREATLQAGQKLQPSITMKHDTVVVRIWMRPDTVFAHTRDTLIVRKTIEVPVPAKVETLKWWQQALIRVGALALVALALWLTYRLTFKKLSILNLITKLFKK